MKVLCQVRRIKDSTMTESKRIENMRVKKQLKSRENFAKVFPLDGVGFCDGALKRNQFPTISIS
jgi:hypothetical protein